MNEKIMDVLKLIADKRMENILDSVYNEDAQYRGMTKNAFNLGKIYDSLDLEPDIREVVDKLLAERDGLNIEKVSLAYWAGVKDAVLILRELGVIEL